MNQPLTVPADTHPCVLHKNHGTAKPVFNDRHHVLPLYLGGEEDDETIVACPNGHQAIHAWLRAWLANRPTPRVARTEKHWAVEGLRRAGYLEDAAVEAIEEEPVEDDKAEGEDG